MSNAAALQLFKSTQRGLRLQADDGGAAASCCIVANFCAGVIITMFCVGALQNMKVGECIDPHGQIDPVVTHRQIL